MAGPSIEVFNPFEQLVSSDLNSAQALSGREVSDLLMRLVAVDQQGFLGTSPNPTGTSTPGGVLTGLDIAPVAGMVARVNPGQAYRVNTAPASKTSQWSWIRLSAAVTTDLLGGVVAPGSGVNWYLVEATDATVNSLTQSRNVFDPTQQQIESQTVPKQTDPAISQTGGLVLKGPVNSAIGTETIPTTDAGYIALGYIRVPTGTVALLADNIVDARVMLQVGARGKHGILGGLTIALQALNTLTVGQGFGFAGGFPVRAVVDVAWGLTDVRFSDAASKLIGSGGAANSTFYCYLVPNSAGSGVVSNGSPTAVSSDSSGYSLVISTTPPTAGGIPSAAWPAKLIPAAAPTHLGTLLVPNQMVGANVLPCALFIGQITTDANGNISSAAA